MKNIKRFLVVAFAFLVTLTFTGCGKKNYTKSNLSAKEAFEKSNTGTATVENYKMDFNVEVAGSENGKEYSFYMKDTTTIDTKNMTSYNVISTNMLGTDLSVKSYAKYDENTVTTYSELFGQWTKVTTPSEGIPNTIATIDDTLNFDNIKEIDADKDNYNYEATISMDDLKKIAATTGEGDSAEMFTDMPGDVKMIISFDRSTGYLSGLKVDLMDLIKAAGEQLGGATFTKAYIEFKFYDFGKSGEVVIPNDAIEKAVDTSDTTDNDLDLDDDSTDVE